MQGERTDLPPRNWIEEMIERECIPQAARNETVETFAKRNKISVNTYWYQARQPDNQKKILELSLNLAKRAIPDVLKILVENATKGKERSVEMYLDYIVKLAKNLDIKSDGKEISTLNYEQALAIIGAAKGSNPGDSTK